MATSTSRVASILFFAFFVAGMVGIGMNMVIALFESLCHLCYHSVHCDHAYRIPSCLFLSLGFFL